MRKKLVIDCSNFTCSTTEVVKTGIQEVIYQFMVTVSRLRSQFPELEIILLPALPLESRPDGVHPIFAMPHFNPDKNLLTWVENELNLSSEELWGFQISYSNGQIAESQVTEIYATADAVFSAALIDSRILKMKPGCKFYSIFYDTTPILFPEYTDEAKAKWFRDDYMTSLFRASHRIFGISRHTCLDGLNTMGWEFQSKLRCLPLPFPKYDIDQLNASQLQLPEKYLIAIGSVEPRKNYMTMIRAFEHFKARNPDSELKFVHVGGTGWKGEAINKHLQGSAFREDFKWMGYLSDMEMAQAVYRASGLMMLSHYEGFGIPVAIAQSLGVPVITNLGSSLPEACCGNAIFVDSSDPYLASLGIQTLMNQEASVTVRDPVVEKWDWNEYTRSLLTEIETSL